MKQIWRKMSRRWSELLRRRGPPKRPRRRPVRWSVAKRPRAKRVPQADMRNTKWAPVCIWTGPLRPQLKGLTPHSAPSARPLRFYRAKSKSMSHGHMLTTHDKREVREYPYISVCKLLRVVLVMGSATGGSRGSLDPQFLEKINEFLKFTRDF